MDLRSASFPCVPDINSKTKYTTQLVTPTNFNPSTTTTSLLLSFLLSYLQIPRVMHDTGIPPCSPGKPSPQISLLTGLLFKSTTNQQPAISLSHVRFIASHYYVVVVCDDN